MWNINIDGEAEAGSEEKNYCLQDKQLVLKRWKM